MKTKKYWSARFDRVFKKIMLEDESDLHLLEALLSTILDGEVKIISLPRTELTVDTIKEKVKTGDLVIELNGKYINLEVETGVGPETRAKNYHYLSSMYKKNIVRGSTYAIDVLFLQIILQYGLKENHELFEWYKIQSKKHVFVENVQILEINMEKIKKIWYSNITEDIKKYKYLIMLDLEKEELEKFEKEDAIVSEFKSKLFELNENESFVNDMTKEEEAMLVQNTARKIAYEEGEVSGMEQGEKKKQIEIAKNLISLKIPEKQIVIATKLSLEEIETLSKE